MNTNRFRIIFIFALLENTVAETLLEKQCMALATSYKAIGYGDCFASPGSSVYNGAMRTNPCNDLEGGRLAFVPNSAIIAIAGSIYVTNFWIGLYQLNNTGSLSDYWVWDDLQGNTYPEPYLADLWKTGTPSLWSGCGVVLPPELTDLSCTLNKWPLCQYVNPRQKYSLLGKGKRAATHAVIQDVTVPLDGAVLRCGRLCKAHPLCYGFSINEATGHCLTERDTGTCPEFPLVDDSSYDMYGRVDPQ